MNVTCMIYSHSSGYVIPNESFITLNMSYYCCFDHSQIGTSLVQFGIMPKSSAITSVRMPIRHTAGHSCALGQITKSGELTKSGEASDETFSETSSDPTRSTPPLSRWRTFGSFALVYLTQGTGKYQDARGRDMPLQAGDTILVFPTLAHRYGPTHPGESWREIYLVFQGPIFDQWLSSGLLNEHHPIFRLQPIHTWRRRIAQVIDDFPPNTPQAAAVEVCRLQQLLADMLAAAQSNHPDSRDVMHQSQWLAHARQLLEQGLTPRLAADQLSCAHDTFRKKFTQLAGLTPARYQTMRLIDHACELMHLATLTDKAIAQKLGFCDEFHFSKRFKQITGLSPRAYRHQLP